MDVWVKLAADGVSFRGKGGRVAQLGERHVIGTSTPSKVSPSALIHLFLK